MLQGAFRFAVFPYHLLTLNPLQFVKIRQRQEDYKLFPENDGYGTGLPTISCGRYKLLTDHLKRKGNPALLPIQIACYTGLRIGEVFVLTWQDIDRKEQTITVRRSMHCNEVRHKMELGTTKRGKVRTADFCDTLEGNSSLELVEYDVSGKAF